MTAHSLPRPFANATPAAAVPVSVAYGDGIGPEIMRASLRVLAAAGAQLAIEEVQLGEQVYLAGHSAGITPDAWDSLRRTRVFYKAPITTPQGGGYKSLNVTVRKSLGLFANVRPCRGLAPAVATRHPDMDLVIIRENEEDLYAGIEHRQTRDVYQCLKLITRPGCEKIIRYAFDYARAHGRRHVTCLTKDNIMKLTDGLFHRVFDEVKADYPEIATDHMIIDIGAARLADNPEQFDVLVMPNLYGDILSDIALELTGSVGLGASNNIGANGAMFEAIHGSAPTIAGQGIANPSGLLLAGAMMLDHVGQGDAAARVRNAWLKTLEDGVHTADIHGAASLGGPVGTEAFADAIIARMGEQPRHFRPAARSTAVVPIYTPEPPKPALKQLVGVDVFVDFTGTPDELATALNKASGNPLVELQMITNRGVKVWPQGLPETFCTDHWRCRFVPRAHACINRAMVIELLRDLHYAGIDFIKTEHLYTFDGDAGYSLGQGQ
ncbi:NADP-dependent isocitrate dehydrogenase [Sphingomonas sp. KRR8]|uniref:NADP-dependent isocitrate dehydrogenase n=1 Tax=Sphingomonas sp. KRR8 TaxID=2942996 RepID=UPI0020217085|nr:NADP-dependent isocitrate dehydrogenase [Sphingomonas sp. KRR8]URD59955.1 NADP-dependent isocitrate dehydrogenase [Sphingomonas sp. KRR8]